MGKRGPKPKPAAVRKLDGNPGKRPILEPEVVAHGEVSIPPHLHDDAQACVELIKRSMPAAVYSALDVFALSAFATAWAWHKHAAHAMCDPAFQPVTVDEKGVERPNAWFRILNGQSAELRAWGDRLGLTPAARANLKLPGRESPRSKFDGLSEQLGSSASLNS